MLRGIIFRLALLHKQHTPTMWAYLSYWRGILRGNRNYVLRRISGEVSLSEAVKVAVFVNYDASSIIHDYVMHYIQEINDAGFAIVFVSNSQRLDPAKLPALVSLCGSVIHRSNVGYDFGGYKDGIASLGDLSRLDELLIANDSVYGPFTPLAALLHRGASSDDAVDVWGMTDGWDRAYHLQSYFILFHSNVLRSPAFRSFWAPLRYVQSKRWVSRRYEIDLTRVLMRAGFRCKALFPHRAVATDIVRQTQRDEPTKDEKQSSVDRNRHKVARLIEDGVPLNATHFFWRDLIERHGYPFLKRELLEKNPMDIPDLVLWKDVVDARPGYDTELIVQHLEHAVRRRFV